VLWAMFALFVLSSKAISLLVFHWMRVVAVNFFSKNSRGSEEKFKKCFGHENLKSRVVGQKLFQVIFFLDFWRSWGSLWLIFLESCTQNQNSDMYHSSQNIWVVEKVKGGIFLKSKMIKNFHDLITCYSWFIGTKLDIQQANICTPLIYLFLGADCLPI